MKKTMKTTRISDFFGGGKSQKTYVSSSPYLHEPEVEINNHKSPIQEETNDQEPSFIPSQEAPQNETRPLTDDGHVYNIDLLLHDPGLRLPISSYPLKDQDKIRRGFIAKGACRPRNHCFPQSEIGIILTCARRFNSEWYDDYHWLEYSVSKDAAFCFVCYLFKEKTNHRGGNSFLNNGFKAWNHARERFDLHVGKSNASAHKRAQEKYNLFINPRSSIVENLNTTSKEASVLYKARLTHSLDCVKYLLRQGLACRGHDESETSNNKGNFRELLQWLANKDENVNKVVLNNAPGNSRLYCPEFQKDLIHACAKETTKLILDELNDNYFSILADESGDVSHKEQLAICLRLLDRK